MRLLPLAASALAVLAAGCGETLVDHNAIIGILDDASTCGEGQVVCDGVCTTQSAAACGSACTPCPAAPAHAEEVCIPTGPGGHEGSCEFRCEPGLLRCASGASGPDACCAPALVAAGGEFSCASTTAGDVHCFGAGDAGQLGTAEFPYVDMPAGDRAVATRLRGFTAAVDALVAGGAHACASSAGVTRCWGNGAAFGMSGTFLDPVSVATLAGATALAAGKTHTCGIVADEVRCVGTAPDAGGGRPSLDGTAVAVAAGDRFTCALVESAPGTNVVKCWGQDTFGQLGGGATGTSSSVPVTVGSLVLPGDLITLAAGARHACAGNQSGAQEALWCWGSNAQRQAAEATAEIVPPTLHAKVKGKPILALSAGDQATCALEGDAAGNPLSCWSSNALVAGGLSTIEPNDVVVAAGSFSAGALHTCYVDAVASPARLKCFGTGSRGRLGGGGTNDSAAPGVPVLDR